MQRLELLMRFPRGQASVWGQDALQSLECYRDSDEHYSLPAKYLREAEGYYVSGSGMGLGENRRKLIGIEVESTFRVLKIKSLL